jgi:hypothetical protein
MVWDPWTLFYSILSAVSRLGVGCNDGRYCRLRVVMGLEAESTVTQDNAVR